MNQYVFFDGPQWKQLFPLTLTRATCDIRSGIWTSRERLQSWSKSPVFNISRDHLADYYAKPEKDKPTLYINGAWLFDHAELKTINSLQVGESIWKGDLLLAYRSDRYDENFSLESVASKTLAKEIKIAIILNRPEDIFLGNGEQIRTDYSSLDTSTSNKLDDTNSIVGDRDQVFCGEGVSMNHCILNVMDGPIYIGANATILEGAMLRGPLVIGEKTVVKMGAKIYGETTIGPNSKVGGEIKRAVIFGNSNKGHEGYLGDSVVGEWCNFGADTNTSNMKNTYGFVNLWDIHDDKKRNTEQQFCGLMMGDHSRCGINTQFNTGSVVGVFTNIFDTQPDTYTPSFSWGLTEKYDIEKAFSVMEKVYSRRDKKLSRQEKEMMIALSNSRYAR